MSQNPLPLLADGIDDAEDFLCARCARRQPTCCHRTDIVLTSGDLARVAAHVGHVEFIDYRPPGSAAYADQDDDPIWRDATFNETGRRRVIRWQTNGDCHFLGPAGCQLPIETRPLICRLYPFDYSESGLSEKAASGCPTNLLAPGQDLFDALQMSRTDAERWHRQLYTELKADVPARAPRPVTHLDS